MESRVFADPIFRDTPCVICIGVFDGFHLGHQAIIDQTIALSHQMDAKSVVMTFSKNPKMASGAMRTLPSLQTVRDFEEMLANRGVDYHCVIDFSDNISKLAGEEFITLLCTSYKVRAMVVGDSFRCGRPPLSVGPQQIGELLKYTSSALLKVMPSVFIDGDEDSSSLIRRCLLTGDLGKASRLLGRAYSLDLRGIAFASSDNRLLYDVRTLGLLLPPAGKYMVEATACGLSQICEACISEDYLALELPVRMKPDRISFLGE